MMVGVSTYQMQNYCRNAPAKKFVHTDQNAWDKVKSTKCKDELSLLN